MGILDRFRRKREDRIRTEVNSRVSKAVERIKNQVGYSGYGNSNYLTGSFSGGGKWPYSLSGSGFGLFFNHNDTRLNARTAYQDTPQARSVVDRFADITVDSGLRIESTPEAEIIGISEEQAEMWASNIERRFDMWCRHKWQHRAGNMTFYQAQRLYAICQQRDNDMFYRLYYSPDRRLLNPLQFEFIDPSQLCGDGITNTYGLQETQGDGINRDSQGREVSYDVLVKKQQNKGYEKITIPRIGPKSGRVFMGHGFTPIFAGQGRGYSRIGHILQDFQAITDFKLAHIMKAINESNISLWVEPADDAPATNPFESIATHQGAGPASVQFGSDPNPNPDAQNLNDTALTPLQYYQLAEATLSNPGQLGVFNLNKGEKLRTLDGKAPSDNYDKFVDAFTSYLCASVGMPIEVLLMKFNQNYSASRASLILCWRIANIWIEEMASDFMNPIFEMWLSEEIAAGRIRARGWRNPLIRRAWLSCRWIGAPMPNIDPSKTADAEMKYATMGATDLDRIARNYNGSDGKSNRARLKKQYTELSVPTWENGEQSEEEREGDDE